MSNGKRNFIVFISILLLCILINGCITVIPGQSVKVSCSPFSSQQPATSPIAKSGPTRPHPPIRTGTISIGAKTQMVSQSVGTSGGTIAINKPGDSLDGFVIDVAPGTLSNAQTFQVFSAPITGQNFGSDINPITPMITVDNGGRYSNEIMYIRIPVSVPQGKFAMGFIYDEKSKTLEGMPLAGRDTNSITVATRHFSSFFASMIDEALLNKSVDSGFRPGVDDWQFTNRGSYVATGGHCAGQSIAAMWYYHAAPDGKDACLYGRYDNNGEQPETPELWEDDSLGYRFCSTIQKDYTASGLDMRDKWIGLGGIAWKLENNKWKLVKVPGIGEQNIWRLFAYSIQATGQPQFVSIWADDGGGHAMICYGVSSKGDLLISDPNYPGNTDRKIEFVNGKFSPYNSGANRTEIEAGRGKPFPSIFYAAGWTLVPFDNISSRWDEFKNKTIGNNIFPAYSLKYKGDTNEVFDLVDNALIPGQLILVGPQSALGANMGTWVYSEGERLTANAQGKVTLKPGKNKYGFYTVGKVNNQWHYVDFKYLTLTYGSLIIDPSELEGETNKEYTFTASTEAAVGKARFEWSVDGTAQKSKLNTLDFTSSKEGTFDIECKLYDDATPDKKLVGEGTATATIKKGQSGSTPAFVKDTKYISFVLNPKANCVHDQYKDDMSKNNYDTVEPPKLVFYENNIPITWSGANFSGKYKGKPAGMRYIGSTSKDDYTVDCSLQGSVSSDGKTIKQMSLTAVYTRNDGSYVETWKYEFTDVPFTKTVDTMKHEDSSIRTLHRQFEVYSSNNPAAHGKFVATYKGQPEQYRSLSGQNKQSSGTGTCINGKWEYYSIKDLGPIRFALKINNVIMNGL